MKKFVLLFFAFFVAFRIGECHIYAGDYAYIAESQGVHYFVYTPEKKVPDTLMVAAKTMYYQAYDPSLYKEISCQEMRLAPQFSTYEAFLYDLIEKDFVSYTEADRYFFFATQGNHAQESFSNLIALCVVLPQKEKGNYYIDHLGVAREHQGKGIGPTIMSLLESYLPGVSKITLDTRVFNKPAQKLYEKMGYTKIKPPAEKEGLYLYYQKIFCGK